MLLDNSLNLKNIEPDFSDDELKLVKDILIYYDEYLDDSHNSNHILKTIDNVDRFYEQMTRSSEWFKNNISIKMCKIVMLCHDLGNIESIFNYISSRFPDEIVKDFGWDKQKIIRKNHHFVGYKFIYLINNSVNEMIDLNLPFDVENLKNLCAKFDINLICNAIYHHRASNFNDFELNDLDMFVRSCDGFNIAQDILVRAKNYAFNNIINKDDKKELGKNVRFHMMNKYIGREAYAETLPITFIDDEYQKELKKLVSILNVYDDDYRLCEYMEKLDN